MRPDRTTLRKLAVGEKVTAEGIEVERMRDGDLRFRVCCRIDNQRIHRVVGFESDGTSWGKARAYAERLRTQAREGRLQLPKGRKVPLSFAQAAERYLDVLRTTDGRNIARKEMQLRRHLCPVLGSQRLDTLDNFALQRYRRTRRTEGASNATVNRELATVSQMLTVALGQRWIDARPCRVPRIMESRKPRVLLSDAECEALLAAAADDCNPRLWIFVAFALSTAMRHGEIMAARFDQVDFENHRLVVPTAKSGQRLQPLTPELVEALQCEREMAEDATAWIFPKQPGNPAAGHSRGMTEPFRRAVIRAKLEPGKVTPHLLRHGGITRILQAGTDLRTAQAISGHKTLAMLLHYSHTARPEVDRAMESLRRPLNVTQTSPKPTGPPVVELRKRWGTGTSR
jgi:integrase